MILSRIHGAYLAYLVFIFGGWVGRQRRTTTCGYAGHPTYQGEPQSFHKYFPTKIHKAYHRPLYIRPNLDQRMCMSPLHEG